MGVPMMPRPMNPMLRGWFVIVGSLGNVFFKKLVVCPYGANLLIQPRPASVVAVGLYSQPIQPS